MCLLQREEHKLLLHLHLGAIELPHRDVVSATRHLTTDLLAAVEGLHRVNDGLLEGSAFLGGRRCQHAALLRRRAAMRALC